MENCVDVKALYELLDDAERRLEDAAREMRLLLEDAEQKALPEEEAVRALRDSLKEISDMRTELAAKGAPLRLPLPIGGGRSPSMRKSARTRRDARRWRCCKGCIPRMKSASLPSRR